MYYVYILKGNAKHYVGYTNNIKARRHQHLHWKTPTTSKMWILSLCGYFLKETKTEAIKLENMIKRNGHIQHRLHHSTFISINEDDLAGVAP